MLKSKRGDASKEVAKDPNKLKRPIKFEAKVVRFFSFCCCSAAFRLCRNTVVLHATELLNFLISEHLRNLVARKSWKGNIIGKLGYNNQPSKLQRGLHLKFFSTGMRRLESREHS